MEELKLNPQNGADIAKFRIAVQEQLKSNEKYEFMAAEMEKDSEKMGVSKIKRNNKYNVTDYKGLIRLV